MPALPVRHLVSVGDSQWDLGRPVLDAHQVRDRIVIVFDYMSFPRHQQAKNLMAYDLNRNLLWVAEHPTKEIADTYVNIFEETPLKASNFAGYLCEIDIETGKLLNAEFTK
jgi:hypothetical protein